MTRSERVPPGQAFDSNLVGRLDPAATHLHPLAAALAIAAWLAAALALAQASFARRDA